MITNPKPCKGIGKAKGQKGCGMITSFRKYGLCNSCLAEFILNTDAGKLLLEKAKIKASKPRKELEQAREQRNNERRLGWLKINVRTICHDYIKLRDKGKECISCGTPWFNDFQAGHWKKAELYSNLKYDEFNINGQCVRCNIYLDGNVQQYGDRIHNRIGREAKQRIERLAQKSKIDDFKWNRQDLLKIRDYYKQKIKELKL